MASGIRGQRVRFRRTHAGTVEHVLYAGVFAELMREPPLHAGGAAGTAVEVWIMQQTALECTECGATLAAQPRMQGEIIDCTECGVELEVVSLSPLRVQVAPEVEEDWGE